MKLYKILETDFDKFNVEVENGYDYDFYDLDTETTNTLTELLDSLGFENTTENMEEDDE